MVLLGKIMILQGVGHPISCLGVCYANDPKKGGYTPLAPALDLTTSLRGDFRRLRRMPYTLYILLHVCSIYLVFQTTMPQRSLSVYFSSPVPRLPRAKREDVIDALLYFRFKDWTPELDQTTLFEVISKK